MSKTIIIRIYDGPEDLEVEYEVEYPEQSTQDSPLSNEGPCEHDLDAALEGVSKWEVVAEENKSSDGRSARKLRARRKARGGLRARVIKALWGIEELHGRM